MQLDFPRILRSYSWLFYLIASLLLFALGSAVSVFLGAGPEANVFLLGLSWVFSLVLFTHFAYRYFDLRLAAERLGVSIFGFLPWRSGMLIGIVVSATLAASMALMLLQLNVLTQEIWFLMLLIVAGACLYALPPVRLAVSGYGELLIAVMLSAGVPAFSFMLFFGGYHRFLAMIAFPLAALHLAMNIALDLPEYAVQQKYEIRTLLMRLGWENGMGVHNLLILSAFLLITVASLLGFPRFALYPVLLVFPLGGFEIYYMMRISAGVKPNWNALVLSAVALFALPIYIFTLAFWTR